MDDGRDEIVTISYTRKRLSHVCLFYRYVSIAFSSCRCIPGAKTREKNRSSATSLGIECSIPSHCHVCFVYRESQCHSIVDSARWCRPVRATIHPVVDEGQFLIERRMALVVLQEIVYSAAWTNTERKCGSIEWNRPSETFSRDLNRPRIYAMVAWSRSEVSRVS